MEVGKLKVGKELNIAGPVYSRLRVCVMCLSLSVIVSALGGAAVAQEVPTELLQLSKPFATVDTGRLFVVGPADGRLRVGGMAVDHHGNVYVSEVGSGSDDGSIIMIPKETTALDRPIRFIRGLTRPGDIELTGDERTLVVSEAGGAKISRHAFGITVLNADVDVPGENVTVYAKTDLGPKKAPGRAPDELYHIPAVLVPGQVSPTVDIVVQGTTLTKVYRWRSLGQPGESGSPFGQTIVDLAQ